ncbi:ABC transporter ATP-binding protein [Desulfovibrio sp. OttesenSCG-928-A18]|nr:ABC transporter ATP-binding protein [Desulfovibrio sp. OttesenSCG-928-A18]
MASSLKATAAQAHTAVPPPRASRAEDGFDRSASFGGDGKGPEPPCPPEALRSRTPRDGAAQPAPLLRVENLHVGFAREGRPDIVANAVDGVSFSLQRGKVLCLVGESGCGKSVTALSLLRLLPSPPALYRHGSALFEGRDLLRMPEAELRRIRGNRAGMVFQDPMTSLNPVMRVGDQIGELLRQHRRSSRMSAHYAAIGMLRRVGIFDAAERVMDFPHQMSGGMRQRVMIAMALACNPDLLIADEPTTALDVTVQKQILGLMRRLIDNYGSALLFITHDLGIVAQMADDVAVMYAGRIVEQGPAASVLGRPAHPYTAGLLRSRPGLGGPKKRLEAIPGTVPGLWSRPPGCAFHPRCTRATAECREHSPPFFDNGLGSLARCWLLRG